MDKGRLLERCGVPEGERPALRRVLDRLCRTLERDVTGFTDFLTPAQQTWADAVLRAAGIPPGRWGFWGGYPEAERKIARFAPEGAAADLPIRCLRASFREEEGLSHRDLLGSLTALGVAREKLGDLLVFPGGAHVLVLDTAADFLLQNWQRAGRAALRVQAADPGDLRGAEPSFALRRETVASLRLDALCAAVFRLSRSRAAREIAGGRVQVEGAVCCRPERQAAAGERISLRGSGKFLLERVDPPTKKGRIPVTCKLYL